LTTGSQKGEALVVKQSTDELYQLVKSAKRKISGCGDSPSSGEEAEAKEGKEKEEGKGEGEDLSELTSKLISATRNVVASVLDFEANQLLSENSNPEFSSLIRASMRVCIIYFKTNKIKII
jgi:hypothetical protein